MSVVTWYGDEHPASDLEVAGIAANWHRLKWILYAIGIAIVHCLCVGSLRDSCSRMAMISVTEDFIPLGCYLIALLLSIRVLVHGAWFQKLVAVYPFFFTVTMLHAFTSQISSLFFRERSIQILSL